MSFQIPDVSAYSTDFNAVIYDSREDEIISPAGSDELPVLDVN